MSYILESFGRALPDSLWPVFRDYLKDTAPKQVKQPASTAAPRRTHSHVLAGVAALQHSSGGEAKLHFDRAISNRDRSPSAIIGMACALDMLGQANRARRYLKVAKNRFPKDAKLHYALGLLEERSGAPDRALTLYQHSLYFQPHQKSSRYRMMALSLAKADYTPALQQAEALATQHPLELPNWTRLGALHLLADDPTRAIKAFDEALKLLADNWQTREEKADEHEHKGNIDKAISHLERTIASGQNFADLHVRLGDLYMRQHRNDEALEEYRQALNVNPYYLEATTKIAACHIQANDREEAGLWLGKAIEINEMILMAYVGLALAHSYVGKDAESRSDLELARGIASNAPVLMAEIVRLHTASDREAANMNSTDQSRESRVIHKGELLKRAIQTHLAWLATHQDDASAWLRLGMLLEADKQPDEAREIYAKVVETYPGCTFALVRLGLAGPGCDSATSGMLRRTIWPEKIDLDTHYGLSVLFSQSQRFELTAEQFGQGLSQDQNECFWRNVALSLEQMGMLNKPKCLWQSLTEIQVQPVAVGTSDEPGASDRADSL